MPAVVELESGPVTLEPLDQLIRDRDAGDAKVSALRTRAKQLIEEAATKSREGARYLAVTRLGWNTAPVASQLAALDATLARIDQTDAALADLNNREHQGIAGFFKRFGDRQRRVGLVKQRDVLAREVATLLQTIGEQAQPPTVPEADVLLAPARDQRSAADEILTQAAAADAAAKSLTNEISRRREAFNRLGFDALLTAAWLQQNEPVAISSSVTLKRGEVAWVSVTARLARQTTRTQWAGGSQGLSFPIGHTGIRYRVGSFRGHPIQTTEIRDLDAGTLVVTNQRLVFVGRVKSVTIGLPHLLHIEAYTDALAVFQDRRETPDFFKLDAPQYVLFYVNYALTRLG